MTSIRPAGAPPRLADELIFDSGPELSLRRSLRELWAYRECVWAFGVRNLRVRYKQAILGVSWAVIQPLVFLTIFIIFFNQVAGVSGGGTTYAAFALSALVPWQFVSSAVSLGGQALIIDAAGLLRKVYFPREAPIVGTIGSFLPDLMIGLGLVLIGAPLTGAHFGPSMVLLPLLCAGLVIPVVAITLPVGALAAYYRDFKYALPFLVQLWLFTSPVAYPLSEIPHKWQSLYAFVNPIAGFLAAFQSVLAAGEWPDWGLLGISLASSVALLALGYRLFKVLEREIADVI